VFLIQRKKTALKWKWKTVDVADNVVRKQRKLISADEDLDALSTNSNHKLGSPGNRDYILA
jgi:hypothetical protein